MKCLSHKLQEGSALVAGVLSGTSADGVDVALGRFGLEGTDLRLLEVLVQQTRPWPEDLGLRVRSFLCGGTLELAEVALLHRDLGRVFGQCVGEVCSGAGVVPDLVGSHGQTVYHHDGTEESGPATLQLGDGDWVAEFAGCPVVSDFRQRDVAAGGDGAPLSAYGDDVLFAGVDRPLCVLNLGGMANITWIDGEQVLAFDTGPAGALLDGLARRLLHEPMDRGGEAAQLGEIVQPRLAAALQHPFLDRFPPKSTGRDTFGEAWMDEWVSRDPLIPHSRQAGADLLATGVAFVARTVAEAMERYLPELPKTLLVAGGGVHNLALMGALGDALARSGPRQPARELGGQGPCRVLSTASVGVDPDSREALLFAVLAARWALGQGVTRPETSGALSGRVLGKLSPGLELDGSALT